MTKVSKYGVYFTNCSFSDINMIKYLYFKLQLEFDQPVLALDLHMTEFAVQSDQQNVIVWFLTYEACYKFYANFSLLSFSYSPYNFNLSQLDKNFTLMEEKFLVNLFEGECCGIILENGIIFTEQQIRTLHSNKVYDFQKNIIQQLDGVKTMGFEALKLLF